LEPPGHCDWNHKTSIGDIEDKKLPEQYHHPAPGSSEDSPADRDVDLWG